MSNETLPPSAMAAPAVTIQVNSVCVAPGTSVAVLGKRMRMGSISSLETPTPAPT